MRRGSSCRHSRVLMLTRALDDGLDVFLGKSGRRVEDGRTAVAPSGIHAVDLGNAKVRGEAQVAVGALNDGDRARLAVGNAPIRRALT